MGEVAFKERSIVTLLQDGRSPQQAFKDTSMTKLLLVTKGLVNLNAWSLSELAWTAYQYPICMEQYSRLGYDQRDKDITVTFAIEGNYKEFRGSEGPEKKQKMMEFLGEFMRLGYQARKANALLEKLSSDRAGFVEETPVKRLVSADDLRPFNVTVEQFKEYDDSMIADFIHRLRDHVFKNREDAWRKSYEMLFDRDMWHEYYWFSRDYVLRRWLRPKGFHCRDWEAQKKKEKSGY